MRIYATGFSDLSGATSTPGGMVHLLEVCRNLQGLGHEVTLVVSSPRPYPESLPFPVVYLPYVNIRFLGTLLQPIFLFICLLWLGLRRRCDMIYENTVAYSVSGALAAKLLGVRHCMHVHGFYTDEMRMGGHSRFRVWCIAMTERINYALTDTLFCVTPVVRKKVMATYGVSADKAHFIYNGVDAERCRPRPKAEVAAELGVTPDRPYVGFIGYLFPWSGIDQLIAAAPRILAACPETRFVIVGHGLWGDQLPGMAEHAGVRANFDFVGYQPWERIPLWSALFDVGVTPYPGTMGVGRYRSSMKSLEYSAAATPVVISRCEGVSDIVENGHCGLVVPPDDTPALADAIIRLLQNPGLRQQLGTNGRQLIEQGYTWRHVTERMMAVADDGKKGAPP